MADPIYFDDTLTSSEDSASPATFDRLTPSVDREQFEYRSLHDRLDEEIDPDQDELLYECDVYLSHAPAKAGNQTLVLNYPLRAPNDPYDPDDLIEARYKPNQQRLQLRYALDTQSVNYDQNAKNRIEAVTLDSERAELKSNYAIGTFNEKGDFVLVPVDGMLTMRPSLAHIDERIAAEREAAQRAPAPSNTVEEVHVQVQRQLTQRQLDFHKTTYRSHREALDREEWITYDHTAIFDGREEMMELLTRQPITDEERWTVHPNADPERYPDGVPESAYQMAPQEYMRRLFPRPAAAADTHEAFAPALEEGLDSNSLEVQLRAALVSLGAATLAQIRSKLHSNPDDTELVNTLRPIAWCVGGNWVAKSPVFNETDSWADSRDLAIATLAAGDPLDRRAWVNTQKLLAADANKLLKAFAVKHHGNDRTWVFKLEDDLDFLGSQFGCVVEEDRASLAALREAGKPRPQQRKREARRWRARGVSKGIVTMLSPLREGTNDCMARGGLQQTSFVPAVSLVRQEIALKILDALDDSGPPIQRRAYIRTVVKALVTECSVVSRVDVEQALAVAGLGTSHVTNTVDTPEAEIGDALNGVCIEAVMVSPTNPDEIHRYYGLRHRPFITGGKQGYHKGRDQIRKFVFQSFANVQCVRLKELLEAAEATVLRLPENTTLREELETAIDEFGTPNRPGSLWFVFKALLPDAGGDEEVSA